MPYHNTSVLSIVHKCLNADYSIASHFDTFKLADEKFNEAPQNLRKALAEHKITEDIFIIPKTGNAYKF